MGLPGLCLGVALVLFSCTTDTYDQGDGKYSYYTVDFVEAHTVASTEVDYCVTDEGDSLALVPHVMASWAQRADSAYRALLSYNKVEKHSTTAFSLQRIPVLRLLSPTDSADASRIDSIGTDPLDVESAWISASRRYLNLGLLLMTGVADSVGQAQMVGIRLDSVGSDVQGRRHVFVTLLHNQNGVPEYYTAKAYVSLPIDTFPHSTIFHISVNTHKGVVVRTAE